MVVQNEGFPDDYGAPPEYPAAVDVDVIGGSFSAAKKLRLLSADVCFDQLATSVEDPSASHDATSSYCATISGHEAARTPDTDGAPLEHTTAEDVDVIRGQNSD